MTTGWPIVPGRVPAISTDTRIISGRVSVLNAGTRPGTSDQDHFLPKEMKYTVKKCIVKMSLKTELSIPFTTPIPTHLPPPTNSQPPDELSMH